MTPFKTETLVWFQISKHFCRNLLFLVPVGVLFFFAVQMLGDGRKHRAVAVIEIDISYDIDAAYIRNQLFKTSSYLKAKRENPKNLSYNAAEGYITLVGDSADQAEKTLNQMTSKMLEEYHNSELQRLRRAVSVDSKLIKTYEACSYFSEHCIIKAKTYYNNVGALEQLENQSNLVRFYSRKNVRLNEIKAFIALTIFVTVLIASVSTFFGPFKFQFTDVD